MAISFTKKVWANGPTGETPIAAEQLNRIETALDAAVTAVNAQTTTTGITRKNLEDATRTIYALNPSTESALTPIAADANTNDAPRIQAMLNYIKNTYGAGTLQIPPGKVSNCNTAITLPAGVQVRGSITSRWDFYYAPEGITALTINDSDTTPIDGLTINGKQWDANASTANTTTSTGLRITGSNLWFNNVSIRSFNTGVDLTADHTYIINFQQCTLIGNKLGINLDLSNEWSGRTTGSIDSGERITITDSLIANCGTAFWATGNGLDLHLVNTSNDGNNLYGRINVARVYNVSSHFEGTYNAETGSTGHPYMFQMDSNARMTFTACDFILGGTAATHIINPANGPANYGGGYVKYTACDVFSAKTAAAASATVLGQSETVVPVTTGATTVTMSTACISKYSRARVTIVGTDGYPQANVTARITEINTAAATLTVTLSAAAPSGTFLEISF